MWALDTTLDGHLEQGYYALEGRLIGSLWGELLQLGGFLALTLLGGRMHRVLWGELLQLGGFLTLTLLGGRMRRVPNWCARWIPPGGGGL